MMTVTPNHKSCLQNTRRYRHEVWINYILVRLFKATIYHYFLTWSNSFPTDRWNVVSNTWLLLKVLWRKWPLSFTKSGLSPTLGCSWKFCGESGRCLSPKVGRSRSWMRISTIQFFAYRYVKHVEDPYFCQKSLPLSLNVISHQYE